MANKPGEANFFPDVPVYPEMGTFQPVYGKFDLTTYIQGASDYEIMAFLVGKYNACLEAYGNITKLSTDTITACKQLQDWINSWFTNLDVQEEINKKLDKMVADGSFGTLLHKTFDAQINQQTTSAVTAWLVANVTPTGSAVVVDKSLSIEGAAADAKATGNGIDDTALKANGLNYTNTGTGYYDLDGKWHLEGALATDKIDVSNYSGFKINVETKIASFAYALCLFDANNNILSDNSVAGTDAVQNITITIPENAKSVQAFGYEYSPKLEIYSADSLRERVNQLESNKTAVDGTFSIQGAAADAKLTGNELLQANGLNYTNTGTGYYDLDGEWHLEGALATDKIDVSNYSGFKISVKTKIASFAYALCLFDANNNILSDNSVAGTDAVQNITITIPENAKSVQAFGYEYSPKLGIYSADSLRERVNQLESKTVAKKSAIILGDSITAFGMNENGWVRYFVEKTGTNIIANVAVDGCRYADWPNTPYPYDGDPKYGVTNVLGNQVQKIINNKYAAPDMIIIAAGTNYGFEATIEELNSVFIRNGAIIPLEEVDRKTTYGAYRWCTEKLHQTYPNAVIFICTPIHTALGIKTPEEIIDFYNSFKIATDYCSHILIDSIHCGISPWTETKNSPGEYLYDGLHPNAKGAKKLGFFNAAAISHYFMMPDAD